MTPEQIRKRQELTIKLNNKTINSEEAEQLKEILEIERNEATQSGDGVALLIIGLLLLALLAYLAGNDN